MIDYDAVWSWARRAVVAGFFDGARITIHLDSSPIIVVRIHIGIRAYTKSFNRLRSLDDISTREVIMKMSKMATEHHEIFTAID